MGLVVQQNACTCLELVTIMAKCSIVPTCLGCWGWPYRVPASAVCSVVLCAPVLYGGWAVGVVSDFIVGSDLALFVALAGYICSWHLWLIVSPSLSLFPPHLVSLWQPECLDIHLPTATLRLPLSLSVYLLFLLILCLYFHCVSRVNLQVKFAYSRQPFSLPLQRPIITYAAIKFTCGIYTMCGSQWCILYLCMWHTVQRYNVYINYYANKTHTHYAVSRVGWMRVKRSSMSTWPRWWSGQTLTAGLPWAARPVGNWSETGFRSLIQLSGWEPPLLTQSCVWWTKQAQKAYKLYLVIQNVLESMTHSWSPATECLGTA